jgi:hypothetical protein
LITIKKVLNLFHVDLHETALYVEFDCGVSAFDLLEQVDEHARQQPFQLVTVQVRTLHSRKQQLSIG